jgi:hypothetical protein
MDCKGIAVYGLGSSDLKWGPLADCFQHGSESLIFTKYGDFVNYLWNYSVLKKAYASWR